MEEKKKEDALYKPNFSLGKKLMRFPNYWIACVSFCQPNQELTALWRAVGFEHLGAHVPGLFQPPAARLQRLAAVPAFALPSSRAASRCSQGASVLASKYFSSHQPVIRGCFIVSHDPSLLLGQIKELQIRSRQSRGETPPLTTAGLSAWL